MPKHWDNYETKLASRGFWAPVPVLFFHISIYSKICASLYLCDASFPALTVPSYCFLCIPFRSWNNLTFCLAGGLSERLRLSPALSALHFMSCHNVWKGGKWKLCVVLNAAYWLIVFLQSEVTICRTATWRPKRYCPVFILYNCP